MTIISTPQDYNEERLYVDLRSTFGRSLYLKCEGFNFAGSIKLKAATEMVEAAERDGVLKPGSILVESSSGNLGVALSMIAASKGYRFLCVTDARCNQSTKRLMEALGSQVHVIVVAAADSGGGLLGARIDYVRALCASDDRYVWLNQYANPNNWKAHYRTTAPAIVRAFPLLDVLFVGAGTTGTLMGCARYLREWHRPVRIVAVDAAGSHCQRQFGVQGATVNFHRDPGLHPRPLQCGSMATRRPRIAPGAGGAAQTPEATQRAPDGQE
jgi:N-(2-amino-2-carboxyethyl)-L-glutamate synthase